MNRRGFLLGLLAAPVIVKASSIMPIKAPPVAVRTAYLWKPVQGHFVITGYDEFARLISQRIEGVRAMCVESAAMDEALNARLAS